MSANPTPLNYAPAPKARGLRRAAILVFFAAILVGAALLYANRKDVKKYSARVGDLWIQHRCVVYSAAPDQIAYTEDREQAEGLLGHAGYFTATYWGRPNDPVASFAPSQCVKLYGKAAENAVVFLHERQTPSGKRVLVLVSYQCRLMVYPEFCYWTRELKTLAKDPPPARFGSAGCMDERPDPRRRRLTLFAGKPDDLDPSHFTIAYRAADADGTLDGYIRENGAVVVTVRDGPAMGAWGDDAARKWTRNPLE